MVCGWKGEWEGGRDRWVDRGRDGYVDGQGGMGGMCTLIALILLGQTRF